MGKKRQKRERAKPEGKESSFPIVGIGASAGGLEAFKTFLSHMPADSGMAFVLVQHLSPDHGSTLVNLISGYTRMEIQEVEDGMTVAPDQVYVIPPGKHLALAHGKLHLIEPPKKRGPRLPIDFLFRSLAQDRQEEAICVVLSGAASDGTLGLKAVKEAGGMAMVQDPQTAEHDSMPRSAMETGLVDYVLPPEEMPEQLMSYVEHAFGPEEKRGPASSLEPSTSLEKVFVLLRDQTGHDFFHYKRSTIHRRIERRMAVNQIGSLEQYVRHLHRHDDEVKQLFRELLISVTNFFRDPEAFQALEEKVIPRLLEQPGGEPIRIWVPGCATGEEAYSIAILLRERMEETKTSHRVQIFATDIDGDAIETARTGTYPDGIAADVPPERLGRFFVQEDSAYRVTKTIRDMIVFAEQNVIGDPPFSNINLISCRNLLIYMDQELQEKVLPLFHYALRPDGFLFLGTSETTGALGDLFETVDQKQRIFRRQESPDDRKPFAAFPPPPLLERSASSDALRAGEREERPSIRAAVEQALLDHYAPTSVIVNASGEVVYFHGRTGDYLEPAPGKATLNLAAMAREGLRLPLSTALRRAQSQEEPIHHPNVEVRTDGERRTIDLTVRPLKEPRGMRGLLLVSFEDVTREEAERPQATITPGEDEGQRVAELEQELRAKEERLQTTIEELETSNEELKSANEELQSSNEELQSTNEELETSQEELQSVNEELRTANAELEGKINELSQARDDIKNMLTGTGVGTVFLDEDLTVRRFTPDATDVLNLIEADVGRPISHVSSQFVAYDELVEDAEKVLNTLVPREREARTEDGTWYLVRILPYRTKRNVIEGVVLTFVEITSLKEARGEISDLEEAKREIEAARDYAQSIVQTVREPLLILDGELRVDSANRAFYESFQMTAGEAEGELFYDLGSGQWDIPELRQLLEEILPQEKALESYEVVHELPDGGERRILLNARELERGRSAQQLILLAIEDITGRRAQSGTDDHHS